MKSKKTQLPYIVAIDFDGVLCEEKYPEIGEPNYEVINKVKYLKNTQGVKFILWTCRAGKYLEAALEWCREQGLEFDAVNENLPEVVQFYNNEESRKISANEYWDDKAVHVSFTQEGDSIDEECMKYCTPEQIASRSACDELGYCPYGIEDDDISTKIANDGTFITGPQFIVDKYNEVLKKEDELSEQSIFKMYELVRLGSYNDIYKDFSDAGCYTDKECRDLAKLLSGQLANVVGIDMLMDINDEPAKFYTITPLEEQGYMYALRESSLRKVEDNGQEEV